MYPKFPKDQNERDEKLALQLIWGVEEWDENNVPTCSFLPRSAERDAYKALCRVLLRPKERIPNEILCSLAQLFDPDENDYPLKAVVKRRHRRPPPNELRAFSIWQFVENLRRDGKSYEEATFAVAEALGKSQEHIKRIYGSVNSDG
jgi:hypothetical protein